MSWWIVENTLVATMLAAVALIVCRLARPRPAMRHALWLIVLVKLATPPFFSWPVADWNVWVEPIQWTDAEPQADDIAATAGVADGATALTPEAQLDTPRDLQTASPDGTTDGEEHGWLSLGPPPSPTATPTATPTTTPTATPTTSPPPAAASAETATFAPAIALSRADIARAIAWTWALGAAIAAWIQLARVLRLRRWLRSCAPAPSRWTACVRDLAREMRVRAPRVVSLPQTASPFVCGVLRPTLVIPRDLSSSLDDASMRGVVLHELAHLKRRDHWVAWLVLVTGILWWFHPLYWLARRELRIASELACDAWVVWSRPTAQRRAYAETLIEITRLLSAPGGHVGRPGAPAPTPGLAMASGPRRIFERRLLMILNESSRPRVPIASGFAVLVLVAASLPGWSQESEPPDTPPADVSLEEVVEAPDVPRSSDTPPDVPRPPAPPPDVPRPPVPPAPPPPVPPPPPKRVGLGANPVGIAEGVSEAPGAEPTDVSADEPRRRVSRAKKRRPTVMGAAPAGVPGLGHSAPDDRTRIRDLEAQVHTLDQQIRLVLAELRAMREESRSTSRSRVPRGGANAGFTRPRVDETTAEPAARTRAVIERALIGESVSRPRAVTPSRTAQALGAGRAGGRAGGRTDAVSQPRTAGTRIAGAAPPEEARPLGELTPLLGHLFEREGQRAFYRLKAEKARAFRAFIGKFGKGVEVILLDDDRIVVHATPNELASIDAFLRSALGARRELTKTREPPSELLETFEPARRTTKSTRRAPTNSAGPPPRVSRG